MEQNKTKPLSFPPSKNPSDSRLSLGTRLVFPQGLLTSCYASSGLTALLEEGECIWLDLLRVVAEPLCTLGSSPTGAGTVGPGRPAAPASRNALWFLPHCDTLASHTPLEREEAGDAYVRKVKLSQTKLSQEPQKSKPNSL